MRDAAESLAERAGGGSRGPLEILLLCDYRRDMAQTVTDHIDAIVGWSRHNVRVVSMFGALSRRLDLERFDALIVHYTLPCALRTYLDQETRMRIASFRGLKVAFLQDEYRWVNATVHALRELGVHVLFTCVPETEIEKVYPSAALPGLRKVNVLTGYVPSGLAKRPARAFDARPVDVGYRARPIPPWLGELGQEKHRIMVRFARDAVDYGLSIDLSDREEDRLYGESWIAFLTRCKAVLGTESGASVFDFDGCIQQAVEAHLEREPDAPFEELRRLYFAEQEGQIRLNQISPRCFEAAALRTLMILYEGEYSGVLEPWRHYVPLRKDHSNMAEVVAVLRDPERASAIIERAWKDVAMNPRFSYQTMVAQLDQVIDECFEPSMRRSKASYDAVQFGRDARDIRSRYRQARRRVLETAHRHTLRVVRRVVPAAHEEAVVRRLRAVVRKVRRCGNVMATGCGAGCRR